MDEVGDSEKESPTLQFALSLKLDLSNLYFPSQLVFLTFNINRSFPLFRRNHLFF